MYHVVEPSIEAAPGSSVYETIATYSNKTRFHESYGNSSCQRASTPHLTTEILQLERLITEP